MLATNSTIWHVFFGESDGTMLRNGYMRWWINEINDFLIYDEVHEAGSDTAIDVLDQIVDRVTAETVAPLAGLEHAHERGPHVGRR